MNEEILDERYSKARFCVDKLIQSMNRAGITRQIQMYRASSAFDFGPLCDLFDNILVSNRERYILNLLQEIDHVTFETGKLRDRIFGEKRRFSSWRSELEESSFGKSYEKLSRKVEKRQKRIFDGEAALESVFVDLSRKVGSARHLNRRFHVIFRDFRVELGEVRSELEAQSSVFPIVLNRFRTHIARVSDRFVSEVSDRRRRKIQNRSRDIELRSSEMSKSSDRLRCGIFEVVNHLSGRDQDLSLDSVNFEEMICDAIQRVKSRRLMKERMDLSIREGSTIPDEILATIEVETTSLEARYKPLLHRARCRRAKLETELDSLLSKIKKLEMQQNRREIPSIDEADDSHRDFAEVTREIDESLSQLSHRFGSMK